MVDNSGYIIWQNGLKVTTRIAVGGDFLPSMDMTGVPSHLWVQKAELLRSYFSDIDYAVVNLECPLACDDLVAKPKLGVGASLYGAEQALHYLKTLNIGTVGMANNHMLDFGIQGVAKTHEALSSMQISGIGADVALGNDPEVKVIDINDVKIGFWFAFLNGDTASPGQTGVEVATALRAGQAMQEMGEGVSCRIALIHAGLERTHYPDPYELKILHGFVDNGFDIVCVSHSHRISGYFAIPSKDRKAPGFCFHGLGSILSGCIYGDPEREGLIAVVGLDPQGKLAELSIKPVWLDGIGWGTIPDRDLRQQIVERFLSVSNDIKNGSFKDKFYTDMGRGLGSRVIRDMRIAFKNRGLKGIAAKLSRIRPKHISRLKNKIFRKVRNEADHRTSSKLA